MEGNMQPATSANIIGPDINEFRGEVNYALLATRTNYCYLRASSSGTGRFRVDKKFIEYARGLRTVGILTGAYHYARPSTDFTDADRQCDDFIAILQEAYGPGKYGDLFPVIDVEAPVDKSISTDTLLDWVDRFRKRFERKTRRILMIYTGAFFIELYNNFYHSKKGFILSNMPLWIAMYKEIPTNPPFPRDQGGWTRWTLWQFTEKGEIAGVQPPTDLNYGPTSLDYLTPPRVVRNFRASQGQNQIYLNWTANTDRDLNGYNIFLNANYVTTLPKTATSYTIKLGTVQKANQRYEVSIEAFDVTGDFSPTRAKAQVTFRQGSYEGVNSEKDDVLEERKSNLNFSNYYKDPVDNYKKPFINNTELEEYEEFEGLEEEFEFRNLSTINFNNINSNFPNNDDDFEFLDEFDFIDGNEPMYDGYMDSSYGLNDRENLDNKPVFKYYLDEEDEEFEDFDNLEDIDKFIPTFNVNNKDYFDIQDNLDDEDFIDDDRFNFEYKEPYNGAAKVNTISTNNYIYASMKEDLQKNINSNEIDFDSYYNENIQPEEGRRYLENKGELRHNKCKKCKKYKTNKKSCYGCKYFFYNLNSNNSKHDNEGFYHYIEEYDDHKHSKKKKHHKHHR